jgi:hypothetical protein
VAGSIDESARRFNPRERPIAELLSAEGREVVAVAEGDRKKGDALVDGKLQEWKSLDPAPANDRTVNNRLHHAKKQATEIFIDARGSRLLPQEAEQGVDDFNRSKFAQSKTVEYVRIEGEGFRKEYSREKDRLVDHHQSGKRRRNYTPPPPSKGPGHQK